MREHKSKNTQYKTKSDLNGAWNKFCESQKGSKANENIPANELYQKSQDVRDTQNIVSASVANVAFKISFWDKFKGG